MLICIKSTVKVFYGLSQSHIFQIGSEPGWSDVQPYSSAGLVMINDTHGQAQGHLELQENQQLYASVRAHTGMHIILK